MSPNHAIPDEFRKGPVVLVSKNIEYTLPLAFGYLAGYLREKGEKVIILYRPSPSEYPTFIRQIMELKPVLVGFGSLYPDLKETQTLIRMLDESKRRFPVVIGGQMVSPIPQFATQVTGADFGVIGEGEITLYQLVKSLREQSDPLRVKGMIVRKNEDFVFTGPGEYIEDLNQLPEFPYEFFPLNQWLEIGIWYTKHLPDSLWRFNDRVINVHGGRGCPYVCNFCYHHSKARYRSVDIIMAEARNALERFNGNFLYFSDETAIPSPHRLQQVLKEIRALPKKIRYSVSCRFDILDRFSDGLLEEMRDTGCRIVGLGIESGSDRILKTIGKRFTVATVKKNLERLKRVGIAPSVSIMVGQMGETLSDVNLSVELVKESIRLDPNINYFFSLATPFPGTQLYNHIFQNKLLDNEQQFFDLYFKDSAEFKYVVNLSAMSDRELESSFQNLWGSYNEEKKKNIHPLIPFVEKTLYYVCWKNDPIEKRILNKALKNKILQQLGVSGVVTSVYRVFYRGIMSLLTLIKFRLKHLPSN